MWKLGSISDNITRRWQGSSTIRFPRTIKVDNKRRWHPCMCIVIHIAIQGNRQLPIISIVHWSQGSAVSNTVVTSEGCRWAQTTARDCQPPTMAILIRWARFTARTVTIDFIRCNSGTASGWLHLCWGGTWFHGGEVGENLSACWSFTFPLNNGVGGGSLWNCCFDGCHDILSMKRALGGN